MTRKNSKTITCTRNIIDYFFLSIWSKKKQTPFFLALGISVKSFAFSLDLIYVFLLFKDIDECVNHTCQNGGSCKDGVNNYSCNCLRGFTGDRCQTGRCYDFFFCRFSPCHYCWCNCCCNFCCFLCYCSCCFLSLFCVEVNQFVVIDIFRVEKLLRKLFLHY